MMTDNPLPTTTTDCRIGERAFVFLSIENKVINAFGMGTYKGTFPAPAWLVGEALAGIPSPKLVLDTGGVLYGVECYWGDEAAFRLYYPQRNGWSVKMVDYGEYRKAHCEKQGIDYVAEHCLEPA